MMKKLMIVALMCSVASGVFASKGFQLSLTPDIAIVDRDTEINGVSLGVWNENPSPKFQWQFGFVNGTTGDAVGVQWFIIPWGIFNYAENFTGLQWGWVNFTKGNFVGWQNGIVNWTAGEFTGFQSGFFNGAGTMKGFQWGAINYCKDLTGLQLGVVNYAQHSTSGVQIGLANIIPENKWFSDGDFGQGMIIFNWGF